MSDRRTITAGEYTRLCEALEHLAYVLLEVGVVELRISKASKELFWDTEGQGQVSLEALAAFVELMERHSIARAAQRKE